MNRDLEIAVLFAKNFQNDRVELFTPVRVLVGTTAEDNLTFYDILSHASYRNLDYYSGDEYYHGFYYAKSLEKFEQECSKKEFVESLSAYLKELRKNAYYYSLEDGSADDFRLKSMPVDEFMKKYSVNISYIYIADEIDKIDFTELAEKEREAQQRVLDAHKKMEEASCELVPINELYNAIKKNVLCQDNQIKRILTAIYKNLIFANSKIKSNIFIYGPTGVGKTAILNQISKELNIPIVIEDSNSYTVAGYKGKDCEEALRHLYFAANGNLELAQHGILVFDEIDKKNKKGNSDEGVSTEGVLNSLLKVVEGGTFEVDIDRTKDEKILFDTSYLTVIVSGAFEKMLNQSKRPSTIGFGSMSEPSLDKENTTIVKQLINYGIPKEFVGRFNTFVRLNALSREDLKHILLHSESSFLKLYIEQLAQMGINLKLNENLIERICDLADERQTGARALNNIVSDILDENIFYDVFNFDMESKEITLDENILKEKKLVLKSTVQ